MKIIENDSVIRTDSNEYGIIIGYWKDRRKREIIEVIFLTEDNQYIYEKKYTSDELPKEIKITDKDEKKYELLMASYFEK